MAPLDTRAAQDLARQATSAASFDPPEWPRPEPLVRYLESAPYPIQVLPNSLRLPIEEVHAFVKAPIALIAASALTPISLAVQGHFDVKRAERLVSPTALFFLCIADSGERKTQVEKFFCEPIRKMERQLRDATEVARKTYLIKLATFEAREAGLKDRIKKLSRDGKSIREAERQLAELEDERPRPPRVPRYLYIDVTPEALAQGLQGWPSAALISSEAGTVFGSHGMGSDSKMRNICQINTLFDGLPLTIDRKTSDPISVHGARLTVGLQVQAATLLEFQKNSENLARGSGLWARFLIAAPASTQGSRLFTEAPTDWPELEKYHQRLSVLLEKPLPLDDSGRLMPRELGLTAAAKSEWVEFYNTVERQLATDGAFEEVRDFASKIADNAARLAACLHVFDGGQGEVSEDMMRRGCAIALWHLLEAKRFVASSAAGVGTRDATGLDNWLIKRCREKQCSRVPRADVMRLGPGATRKKESLQSVLSELAALHRLRFDASTIEINPALLSDGQEAVQ